MWKTLQEAVANKANLFKRRSSPSPICPFCNSKEESMIHLFLQCPWVEKVWHGRMLTRGLRRGEVTSWANWLGVIPDSVNGQTSARSSLLSYVAITCWHIWKARCNFLFNQQSIFPRQIIAAITHSVVAFKETNQTLSISLSIFVPDLATMGSWEAFPILARSKGMGEAFNDCRWCSVSRSVNMAADLLASRQSREVCDNVCDNVWVYRPSCSLVYVLCNDGLHCPP
nr:uncharacterized protein LOC103433721 [Malus domestica]